MLTHDTEVGASYQRRRPLPGHHDDLEGLTKMTAKLTPVSPGEILLEEFLTPLNITQYRLAKDIRVPQSRLTAITNGGRSISADTALRLARYFGTSDLFWLNLQIRYDLEVERDRLGEDLAEITPLATKAS